jgi:hypothetical protein
MRINARLDEESTESLKILKNSTGLTTTQIVKEALACYYRHKLKDQKKGIQRLLESDFVGCGEGPEDLSENYKAYLAESLAEKYDLD